MDFGLYLENAAICSAKQIQNAFIWIFQRVQREDILRHFIVLISDSKLTGYSSLKIERTKQGNCLLFFINFYLGSTSSSAQH